MDFGSSFNEGVSGLPDSVSGGEDSGGGCSHPCGCIVVVFVACVIFSFVINRIYPSSPAPSQATHAAAPAVTQQPTAASEQDESEIRDDSALSSDVEASSSDVVDSPSPTPVQDPGPPEDLAEKLPYKGMPEAWISGTYLGAPDELEQEKVYVDGGYATQTCYRWRSKNGRNDTVFTAYVIRGEVTHVSKWYSASKYWPDLWGPPDLYVQDPFSDSSIPDVPEDPIDYDSAEDYADDASDWYAEHGYEDPWSAAYEYWEDNAE